MEKQSLIRMRSSLVCKIEVVLEKISSKHVKILSGFLPHQSEKRRRCDSYISKIKGKGAKAKTEFLSD